MSELVMGIDPGIVDGAIVVVDPGAPRMAGWACWVRRKRKAGTVWLVSASACGRLEVYDEVEVPASDWPRAKVDLLDRLSGDRLRFVGVERYVSHGARVASWDTAADAGEWAGMVLGYMHTVTWICRHGINWVAHVERPTAAEWRRDVCGIRGGAGQDARVAAELDRLGFLLPAWAPDWGATAIRDACGVALHAAMRAGVWSPGR